MLGDNRLPMKSSGWFLDTGDLKEIRKWRDVIGGVCTNQIILFEREKIFNVPAQIKKICKEVGKGFPISVELPDSKASVKEMVGLGKAYHQLSPSNIVIKVPIIPDNVKGLQVVAELARLGIRTNATIGINEAQLMLAAEAGRNYKGEGDNYVSLLWCRARENKEGGEGRGPEEVLLATLSYLANHDLRTKVIVGSIRQPSQIIEAFELGADIVVVPPVILEKAMVTKRAVESIEEFDKAYLKVKNNPKLKII